MDRSTVLNVEINFEEHEEDQHINVDIATLIMSQ